eukprot:CAMPEP_0118921764 /NCGR_PEP_ID=MMETSP1169-20130426/937_1 /TAXON_ID=36882 /ORGANISM="Pyramimonas obovata, Strain CCMP722" /LENGTH=404 /DNA_ID=CAMNT_0006862543 /DNA_START=663 /DNA_END=1877 /DNA_ORIENTATION=+
MSRQARWERQFKILQQFVDEHGHANVPFHHPSGLGKWLSRQRTHWNRGKLGAERYRLLLGVGCTFNYYDACWMKRFQELCVYHTQHGHTMVSSNNTQFPGLAEWCVKQRHLAKVGKLDDDRYRRLEGLKFVWELKEGVWEQHFEELVVYKGTYGDCNVPKGWVENDGLASWVQDLRHRRWASVRSGIKDSSTLTQTQERRLSQLGFEWDPPCPTWEERYAAVAAVRARGGAVDSVTDQELRQWLVEQRRFQARGVLSLDRFTRLNALGLRWDKDDSVFSTRIEQLEKLIREHGFEAVKDALEAVVGCSQTACLVTTRLWTTHGEGEEEAVRAAEIPPSVVSWYKRQRGYARRRSWCLSPDRRRQLAGLGFMWAAEDELARMNWQYMDAEDDNSTTSTSTEAPQR